VDDEGCREEGEKSMKLPRRKKNVQKKFGEIIEERDVF